MTERMIGWYNKHNMKSKQKLYCYVDESGQDTKGRLFVVGIVVLEKEKDEIEKLLLKIEAKSDKGDRKWTKSRKKERLAYISVLKESGRFKNKLFYISFQNFGLNYYYQTIISIAKLYHSQPSYKNSPISITIDALHKSKRKFAGAELRKLGVKTGLVKGKKDDSSPLLRLADAMAGFARNGIEKHPDYIKLFDQCVKAKLINKLE